MEWSGAVFVVEFVVWVEQVRMFDLCKCCANLYCVGMLGSR